MNEGRPTTSENIAPERVWPDGHAVVITGAGGGIGRSASLAFASEGADLAICDLDASALEETLTAVKQQHPVRVLAEQVDLRVLDDITRFANHVLQSFSPTSLLNNAGVNLRLSIAETGEEDWDRVNAVNVRAPFFLAQRLAPAMPRSGQASITNVSSVSAVAVPVEGNSAYAASKGAVISLTRAMARDLAPAGIRVNCILPGLIDTPMPGAVFDRLPDDDREEARRRTASRSLLKRFGRPEEVAAAAVFLASPAASYMTGAILPVDGGWTAS